MKKILTAVLSAVIALSFVGCSNPSSGTSAETEEKSAASAAESKSESSSDTAAKDLYDLSAYVTDEIKEFVKQDILADNISDCEAYEFFYSSDGYRIKAYICLPPASLRKQEPCKCLMYCRGGHSNYYSLEYETLAAMAAYSGRVVVACEIRGGNGSEGLDQFGGDEMHDVYKLIDLCENNFSFIDMDDFSVLGVSRGGMTTYMAAREDKRIKKIIVCSGVSDLVEIYHQREEKMQQVLRDFIGGTPEEIPEEYEKRSAVYWAEEIKIPVLITHGTKDEKTPYETQAKNIYEKLKDSTDCTLITHDDDEHGIYTEDFSEIKKFLDS